MSENYELIQHLANTDVTVLKEKGKTYGSSWRDRGGVGAFMMLARKWDRIENQSKDANFNIFHAIQKGDADKEGILDDIADLRRYLLLVEAYMQEQMAESEKVFIPDRLHPADNASGGILKDIEESFDLDEGEKKALETMKAIPPQEVGEQFDKVRRAVAEDDGVHAAAGHIQIVEPTEREGE